MNTSHRPITALSRDGKTATARNTILRRSALAAAVAAAFALPAALPVGGLATTALVALAAMPQVAQAAWQTVGSSGFSAGATVFTTLAIAPAGASDAGKLYLAYKDSANSDKATVMKFDGSSWGAVGSAGFSAGGAAYASLAFAADGTPYVGYSDGGNSNKASVMKYDGSSWVAVGSAGFTSAQADHPSLAVAPAGSADAGKPYLAYSDNDNGLKATVMKFNGSSWVVVGSAGFSAGDISYPSLRFAADGTPYVAYQDGGNNNKATVMKFNGSSWVLVGSAGFSAGLAPPVIAFAPNGTPYVAYRDGGTTPANMVTVMKFNGSGWEVVGSAGFSAGAVYNPSLAIASDGTPYVAYRDESNSSKITLMKFTGGSWVVVGSAGFSAGAGNGPSLAIAADGTPYVAYRDGSTTPANMATVMKFAPDVPTLVSSTPADNATAAALGSGFSLTFSEAVSVGTGNLKIVNETDNSTETINVAGDTSDNFIWSNDHKTLTVYPYNALEASKSYHIEIAATAFKNASNVAYPGISDATTLNFSMAGHPHPPTGITATAGNGRISVAFTAPVNNGGSAITSYYAICTSSDGGDSGVEEGVSSPIVVLSLSNDKTYTCTVAASNITGMGTASSPSASAVPALPPSAITVISVADSGAGSLRQAIADLNDDGIISFDPSIANQTITLASTLTVGKNLTIDGGSQNLTVSGNNAVRVFNIADGMFATLQKLTIANGNDATSGGGGIRNGSGTLTLDQVTLSGNVSTGAGGGGLYNASGAVTISNSLFSGNMAFDGGGLRNSGGTLNLTNVTFSGNLADGSGGALWAGGGTVTVNNVTLANNAATNGGGISNQGATFSLKNTLLAANTGGNCYAAPVLNVGYNLDDGTSCGFGTTSHSQSSATPLLGALADNGGLTRTLALGVGSPAINAGNNATCAATDQRTITRAKSVADACDIGAFEVAAVPAQPSVTATGGDTKATLGFATPADNGYALTGYTLLVTPAGGSAVTLNVGVGNASTVTVSGLTATVTVNGGNTSIVVTGLTNGTSYGFTVAAANSVGNGSASGSQNATPIQTFSPSVGSDALTFLVPGAEGHNVTLISGCDLAGGVHRYATQSYIAGHTGNHTVSSVSVTGFDSAAINGGAGDNFIALYNGVFDPQHPTTNLVGCNDDRDYDNSDFMAEFTAALTSGNKYTVVFTAYSDVDPVVSSDASAVATTGNMSVSISPSVSMIYTVGGTVSGMDDGKSVVLRATVNSVNTDLTVSANGSFTFPAELVNTNSYTVTVATQPDGMVCTVTHAGGAIANANAINVAVECAAIVPPDAPTIGSATAGNGSVSVAFTAPENNGGAAITEYTASCAPVGINQFADGIWTASQTGSSSPITVSGLTNGTAYKCEVKASNSTGYGDYSGESGSVTPTAPVVAPVVYYTPPPPQPTNNVELPTGGGTATPTQGQTVTVVDNGKENSTIDLPPPPTTPPTGTPGTSGTPSPVGVNINLPGTGTVSVSSDSSGTKLGVQGVTMPGGTTSVSTVMVTQGSASFTATKEGQPVASLKNGIFIVSGATDSKVTVDATGPDTKIGVTSSDTIVVPTGSKNVSGTSVDLPPPTATGGAASTISVKIGDQNLTVQSSQADTKMTFKVIDIGGVQTPILEVTGSAQVTGSGDNQPIVSIAGNVIKTGKGKSGGSSQVCNTIVQASSDSSSDVVHVVTCYIVLEAGTFSAMGGGNGFAAIKDGIVWAGETAEFDKNGKVTSAYLGSRLGLSDAVGDDVVPGGAKFAGGGYNLNAFIPRIAGTPLRLNGAKLDESIFAVINKALGVTVQPALPVQSDQGVLNFTFNGNLNGLGVQNPQVNYTLNSDTASVIPSRRIRVDTSRADGVSISAEGEVDVATGGLITTFAPSVADPKAFAEKISRTLPGATATLRWNGTWQVTAADGTTYVGRPQWSFWAATPGAATFSTTPDGNLLYSDNGRAQPLFPDFYDYDTLQATFRTELKDPALTVLPRMDGTATATVNGQSYTLSPQWNLIKPAAGKPAWWVESGVVYIKNADGSAQGFTVK